MYKVTELIGKWDKKNHKVPISNKFERKIHTFKKLSSLAEFTRENYILSSLQEDSGPSIKDKLNGNKLYIKNNILWIDVDKKVNLTELHSRMLNYKLLGFAYRTSFFYSKIEDPRKDKFRARIGIICDRNLTLGEFEASEFYARSALNLLNLDYEIDSSPYFTHMYFAKVVGNYNEEDLFVNTKGVPLHIEDIPSVIDKYTKANSKEKRKIEEVSGLGPMAEFVSMLKSFPEVSEVILRNNETVTISFKDIPEKTKYGYYINPKDPWLLFHPKISKSMHVNSILTKSFGKYKEFCLDFLIPNDPFKGYLNYDEQLSLPYIPSKIFKNDFPLIFLESPTGSGKTTAIAEFMENRPNKSVLFISVNRMQAVATKRSLSIKGLDFTCYLKYCKKEYVEERERGEKPIRNMVEFNTSFLKGIEVNEVPDRLICGILSLHHLIRNNSLIKEFDYVIIDEVTTIPNSTSNAVKILKKNLNRFEKDMAAFCLLLRAAKKVICMDGFISNPIVKCITDISKKEPYVIQNTFRSQKKIEIFRTKQSEPKFEDENNVSCVKFFDLLNNDLIEAKFEPGKRVMVIALAEKDASNELVAYINNSQTIKDKKLKVFNSDITSKTGEDVVELFEDFDFYLNKNQIDIIIHSPTITTGIDIPQAEGTNVYFIMSGDYLSPHINYQMTMRGRKAEHYRVLMPRDRIKNDEEKLDYTLTSTVPFNTRLKELAQKTSGNTKIRIQEILASSTTSYCYLAGTILCFSEYKKTSSDLPFIKEILNLSKQRKGLITALRIDKAFVDFQIDQYGKGKSLNLQYINFLKHEGCNISIEEDIKEEVYTYDNYSEYQLAKLKEKFELINFPFPDKTSNTTLYKIYKEVVTVQRIIFYLLTKDKNTPLAIQNAAIVLNRIFLKYGIEYTSLKEGYISISDINDIFDMLHNESQCSRFILEDFAVLVKKEEKKLIVKDLLKKFFRFRADRDSHTTVLKGFYLVPKKDIVKSLKNVKESHRMHLQVFREL